MCCEEKNQGCCNGGCTDGENRVPQKVENSLLIESFLYRIEEEEAALMREIVEGDCYQEGVAASRKLLIAFLIDIEQNLTEEEKVLLSAGLQNPTIDVEKSGINLYCSYRVAMELIREINRLRPNTIFFPIQDKRTKEIIAIGMGLKR